MVRIGRHRRNQQRENVAFMAASTPEPVHWCVLAAEESGYATGVFHIAAYL